MSAHHAASAHSHLRRYLAVWIGLMVLTALTWGLSRFHIPGGAGVAVALTIASVKGALVALFFMHLYDQPGPNRLVLLTSLVFVALLVSLVLLDNATRFPLANPPDAESTPRQLREAVLGERPVPPPPPKHRAPVGAPAH
jgi:cytochrome c oxidase subunit 4